MRLPRPAKLVLIALLWPVLVACQHGGPTLRIERPLVSLVEPLAVAGSWRAEHGAALAALGLTGDMLMETAGPEQAARAVVNRSARFALTAAPVSAELVAVNVERKAVALVAPLTYPLEAITAQQARDIAAGRVRDWKEVGGPSAPVQLQAAPDHDAGLVARVLGIDASSLAPAGSEPVVRGTLRIDAAGGPGVGEKSLHVDGQLPDAPGYPLAEHRVLVARPADADEAEALADRLRRELAARRQRPVVLDAVGDIMLGRSLPTLMAQRGTEYPFAAVQPVMAAADLRFGNLEMALTSRGTAARKDYVFRAAAEQTTAALRAGGFNLLSLANNHLTDYGAEGVTDTLQALRAVGIAFAGAGPDAAAAHAPALVTVHGLRVALLAYVNVPDDSVSSFRAQSMAAAPGRPGVAWGTAEAVRRDVTAARTSADVVIVSIHAGYEYTANPNGVQRELARAAIDSGAALVLGGHPHVLQGIEYYRGVPVVHSLGNFVFDLDADDRRQPGLPSVLTAIVRVTLDRQGVRTLRLIPAIIDEREGRPVPVEGADARRVLDRLYRLTDALATGQ